MESAAVGAGVRATEMPYAARPRLTFLAPLRILASFAVVWHHARQGYLFGIGFGLFLFLVILFGLASSGTRSEPLGQFARRKSSFLLIPWVRWSVIYLGLLTASDLVRGHDPSSRFEWKMVFYGGHPAFWFLPFAALSIVAAKAISRVMARWDARKTSIATALVATIVTSLASQAVMLEMPDVPLRAWLRVTPAIFWGIAVGQSLRAHARERQRLLILVALLGIISFLYSPFDPNPEDLPRRFGVAVPLACLGFAWTPVVPRAIGRLATVTFGVYLVHPLVAKAIATVLDTESWSTMELALLIWIGSALIVLALRWSGLRWPECVGPEPDGPASAKS
ncbi:MAG: acyltransferase family protein [Planctomycetota bacterium]